MSGTMNVWCGVGRVGKDPEVRHTRQGDKVVSFSLATDRWKKGDPTDWHTIVCFGKTADFAEKYVTKGSSVAVKGAIRYEKWEDQNGQKRESTKINADAVELVGGGKRRDDNDAADHPEMPAWASGDNDEPPF